MYLFIIVIIIIIIIIICIHTCISVRPAAARQVGQAADGGRRLAANNTIYDIL